ncbi:MAG: aminotransferase class I/II-fold pyridoxal phosphate-dependent enzyme, partial [Propionivibrio sp.]
MTDTSKKTIAVGAGEPAQPPDFNRLFSERARAMQSSAIREILKITERSDVISFAGGLPAPSTFPVETMRVALDGVLTSNGREALQYSTTEGYAPLREWIAARVGSPEAPVSPDDVLVVSGSQQGLDLLAKVLIDAGDTVLVETPTYLGALQAFSMFAPNFVSIATDSEGLLPETLTTAVRGAKFIYT